jgi:alkanesulfonate monooxygenase SsuD/methylene tetrahydromethanopterin reductase-like flavin-dependent oxidoreductase (luciferase family)
MKLSFLGMAAYDGPAPGMEIWPVSPECCERDTAQTSYQQTIDLCVKAEATGFDWISVSEHHYAPYMMTPNPVVLAGALTQAVKRAKIALLGPLVPLTNPVRVAEEVAMLDCISGGRVIALFLRGTPNEHNTYDTPKDDTRGMTQEGIDLILKAWQTPEPFPWEGKHYQFSNVSVWPRTPQTPHPPVYGSGNSEDSVAFAATRKMGIAFSFAEPDTVKKWVDLYRLEAKKAGWEPTPEHVLYRGISYVASSDEQAEADMGAYFGAKAEEAAKLQAKTMGGPPVVPLIAKPFFVGGPDTILDRFATMREVGVGVVDMCFGIGSHQQKIASLELFSQQCMPTIRGWG